MTNEIVDAEVVGMDKVDTTTQKYIGGKIEIVADGVTGGMSVSHPENIIVALGILEVAKAMIIEKQQKLVAKMQEAALAPRIMRAGPQDIPKLVRPS